MRNIITSMPISYSEEEVWYENYLKNKNYKIFIIRKRKTPEAIGYIRINDIDILNQKLELGIDIIPSMQGKEYGYNALDLIIKFIFTSMNINKIYAIIISTNTKSINLFKKLGFKEEGVFIKEYFKGGTFMDVSRYYLVNDRRI
jgi:diamine N-acetyltransferase